MHEDLAAVLQTQLVLVQVQGIGVDAGAHGAVEDEHTLAENVEKFGTHAWLTSRLPWPARPCC